MGKRKHDTQSDQVTKSAKTIGSSKKAASTAKSADTSTKTAKPVETSMPDKRIETGETSKPEKTRTGDSSKAVTTMETDKSFMHGNTAKRGEASDTKETNEIGGCGDDFTGPYMALLFRCAETEKAAKRLFGKDADPESVMDDFETVEAEYIAKRKIHDRIDMYLIKDRYQFVDAEGKMHTTVAREDMVATGRKYLANKHEDERRVKMRQYLLADRGENLPAYLKATLSKHNDGSKPLHEVWLL